MNRYDVAVVGGGPIGAVAARAAAGVGARVLLVEATDGSGEPARCAGLVSPRAWDALGAPEDCFLREICGGTLWAPGGRGLHLRAEETKALVVDRARLNRDLLAEAARAGVEIRTQTRAVGARAGTLEIEAGRRETVDVGVIIGADGPRSDVAEFFDLPRPGLILGASQVLLESDRGHSDEVDVLFGQAVAPGFFAWAIPAEPGRLRVGLAAVPGHDPRALLDRLLAERYPGRVVGHIGGLIPIDRSSRTVTDGALLVGDAAGQVKPTSGGGLYTGAACARIAGEIAGYASLAGRTDAQTLGEYERRWREAIGDELRFGSAAYRVLSDLSDEEIDRGFAGLDDPEILGLIARTGDIDYPSRLVRAVIAQRDLWPRFFLLLQSLGGWPRFSEAAQSLIVGDGLPPV
jgi:digeranylgeranylglycerophospholipid reductase